MKADVHPATALRQLDIPSWVPDVIAQYVGARYAADVDWAIEQHSGRAVISGSIRTRCADDLPVDTSTHLLRDDVVLREAIADLVRDDLADITGRYLPLACDRRMKGVWRELSRHNSNGGFLHPAIGLDQDAAMLELFETAVMCRKQRGATTTRRAGRAARDHWLARAGELRDDARIDAGVVAARYVVWRLSEAGGCSPGLRGLRPRALRSQPWGDVA